MPRARALRHAILFRGAFLESLETPVFAWLLFGPEHRALSRIDRRFLSLVAASERSIDTSSRHSREKRPAESRRVCFLCQRPRIIDTSPVREPKKEERKKRETGDGKKREIILSLGVAEAPFLQSAWTPTTIYPGVADR